MTESKDNTKKQDTESSQEAQAEASHKAAKKRKKVPVFDEEDLYTVKYDF